MAPRQCQLACDRHTPQELEPRNAGTRFVKARGCAEANVLVKDLRALEPFELGCSGPVARGFGHISPLERATGLRCWPWQYIIERATGLRCRPY